MILNFNILNFCLFPVVTYFSVSGYQQNLSYLGYFLSKIYNLGNVWWINNELICMEIPSNPKSKLFFREVLSKNKMIPDVEEVF